MYFYWYWTNLKLFSALNLIVIIALIFIYPVVCDHWRINHTWKLCCKCSTNHELVLSLNLDIRHMFDVGRSVSLLQVRHRAWNFATENFIFSEAWVLVASLDSTNSFMLNFNLNQALFPASCRHLYDTGLGTAKTKRGRGP